MKKITSMRKITLFSLIFFSFIASLVFIKFPERTVLASPPAPAPKCNIEGVIEDVRFEEAYESECLKTNSCPTDTRTKYPDLYYLTIIIQKVTFKEGNTNFQTCIELFPLNSIKEFNINAENVKNGDIFSKNQNITGIVSSFWGHSFETYDISEASEIKTPPIGQKPPSVFEKMNSFISRILNFLSNFLRSVKTVETKTK